MKKTFSTIAIFFIAALGVILSGCLSPWAGGTANITINLGQGEAGRALVNSNHEVSRMEHMITLRGPDRTISKSISGGGRVTFEVAPGKWRVDVRAIGDRPDNFPDGTLTGGVVFPSRMLRALGHASVDVKGGDNVAAIIKMTTATEASNWDEVLFLIGNADPDGEEIILLTSNMTANMEAVVGRDESSHFIPLNVSLMADQDITILRGQDLIGKKSFFVINYGSSLSLGKSGMTGTITIDGGKKLGQKSTIAPIYINEGIFTMHSGAVISNNINEDTGIDHGGAVHVYGASNIKPAKFFMHGGTITGNESLHGGGVNVSKNGLFIMTGGAITGNLASSQGNGAIAQGGGVAIQGGTLEMAGTAVISGNTAEDGGGGVVLNYSESTSPVFTMRGGSIINNTTLSSSGGGGGVLMNFASSFTMKGGAITGNKALESNGGGVSFLNNNPSGPFIFAMEGGIISGNTAAQFGGGVYINDTAIFTMSGGSIGGNTAAQFGGGIYSDNESTLTMSGGSISGNKSTNGGGIYLDNKSTFTMSRGSINGNTVEQSGGGVCFYNQSEFTMSGGSISGNTANGNGGGVNANNQSKFTMDGGSIRGNKSAKGGGIYSNNKGTFTMSRGSISGNTATQFGGGVFIDDKSEFNMGGGDISGNTAELSGGGVMANIGSTFTMSGDVMVSSNRAIDGGGIYLNQGSGLTMSGSASIMGNTATENGGGVYLSSARYPYSPDITANSFIMEGGTIGGNLAGAYGGGIFSISTPGTISDPGNGIDKQDTGTIYGNDAGKNSNRAGNGNKTGHTAYFQLGLNASPEIVYRNTTVKHTDTFTAVAYDSIDETGWDRP